MKQKTYRTKRLELRELRLSDHEAWSLAHATAQPKVDEWDLSPVSASKRSRSQFKRKLLAQRSRFKKSGMLLWSLFKRDTGEMVGWIDISTICGEPYLMANLGWFVFNTHRRQGYAREAATKLISAAFADYGFHRLEAAINPRNRASIAVARSLGLTREGLKKFYLKENDLWRDMVTFITTPELFYER